MREEKEEERQVRATITAVITPAPTFPTLLSTDRILTSGYVLDVQSRIKRIKEKRAAKEEKERYAKLAEKMNKKRIERLKRKEKRNKLLAS